MSDLYIQRSNYYLSLSEQRIIIKNDNKEIVKEVSISLVDNVLLFGNAQLTTQLIKALSKNKVNVYFEYSNGLYFKDPKNTQFEIAGDDSVFYPAKAVIKNNVIILVSDKVKKPLKVRFAWGNATQSQLFNSANFL